MSDNTIKICKIKIIEFLDCRIIKAVSPSHGQFISHIFPVAKKTLGEYRIIFDLTELNLFVRKVHFKMDSLADIMALIQPGDFFVAVDLSDAYYCIAMHLLSMPYLTFIFLEIYYQFTCLPQGLSSAPRVFTKVMRVVLTYLRRLGIRIAAWIDNFLIAANSRSACQDHAFRTIRTFEELGFRPNTGKSQLVPTQRITHLGLVWDSVEYTVSVPTDKIAGVKDKCKTALSSRVTVRCLSSILGSIEYFRWGFSFAALHYRRLQRFVNGCLDRGLSYDSKVSASSDARIDLSWWFGVGDTLPPRSLSPFAASLELFCDASLSGWGCWTSDDKEAYGAWSSSEAELHINILELKAVMFGFQCFFRSTYNCSILIHSDNCTVVAYINKQGGTTLRSLCDLALELWEFCVSRGIMISAVYLPGESNDRADRLSRMEHCDHSYALSQESFDSLRDLLLFPLSVDCFASRLNFKLHKFVSRYYDPLSSWVNAFSMVWTDNVYLFPPLPVIHRVISKILSDNTGHGLLVCPYWPSQSWFPSLLDMLIAPPILMSPDSVVDKLCRLPRSCQLVAWSIGCSHAERMAYRMTLRSVGSKESKGRLLLPTTSVGRGSVLGMVGEHLITVESL